MYKEHNSFESIDDNKKIWRYMDFTKFVDILENEALFFTRSDRFKDKFEGTLPIANEVIKERESKVDYEDRKLKLKLIKEVRKHMLISCWHINDSESDAMWKLYSQSTQSIAIQTSFGRLKEAFKKTDETVNIGKVKYIDYNLDVINEDSLYNFWLHKRKAFSHENELRAIICRCDISKIKYTNLNIKDIPSDYGENIDVDLNMLIDSVYVSPLAEQWFADLVEKVIRRYGYNFDVNYSKLSDNPIF
ncbi:hypothetical protein [Clostridium baratii]|uniref:hypothetical protein n=1 Tax=Clostridium baratii TaxID=1561 RepID=UPI00097FA7E6|nr:hypothetical protein [Clostridium baratii]AQM61455.1 hypothetical protein NPD11_2 [Clostridium baratii]